MELVAVLRRQHQAGRRLTAEIELGIYELSRFTPDLRG